MRVHAKVLKKKKKDPLRCNVFITQNFVSLSPNSAEASRETVLPISDFPLWAPLSCPITISQPEEMVFTSNIQKVPHHFWWHPTGKNLVL